MKRQTGHNTYERRRTIRRRVKERPVLPPITSTIVDEWFTEWYENHRTQEQLVEMNDWLFRFGEHLKPEQASRFYHYNMMFCSSRKSDDERFEHWDNTILSALSNSQRTKVYMWFYKWISDNHPNSFLDV